MKFLVQVICVSEAAERRQQVFEIAREIWHPNATCGGRTAQRCWPKFSGRGRQRCVPQKKSQLTERQ